MRFLFGLIVAVLASVAPAQISSGVAGETGVYALEKGTTFNVLDSVVFDPARNQVTLIGHHDKKYGGKRIPYLQHLAALLENPNPKFSLNWTSQSEARVDDLFRRMDSDAEVRRMASKWGYWIDSSDRVTPMGRFFMPLFGVTPTNDRYGAIASILRAGGNSKGANIIDKAGVARRNMTNQTAMQNVIYAAVGYDGVGRLQDRARRGELNKRQFEIALGRAICNGMDSAFGLSGRPVYNSFNRALSRGIDFGSSLAKAFGELDNQLRSVLKIAMGKLFRRHEFITVPPAVMHETLGVRPEVTPEYIGVDKRSQLARVMFESDRLGKQLPNMVRLQGRIPGYKTNFAFNRANPRKAGSFKPTSTKHLWISIDKLDMAQSKDRYTLQLRGAKMRFNIRELKDDRSVQARPGGYEKLLTSLYDHFAKEFPVFHELRETAKLKGAADWLKKHKPNLKLPTRGRVPWSGPSKIPGLLYFTWTPNPRPGTAVASMMAMGGVSLGIGIARVPVDGLVVDLRSNRLVAVPPVGPSGAVGLAAKNAKEQFPYPLGLLRDGLNNGKPASSVSIVVGGGEGDEAVVVRRGSDLDAQALVVWKKNDLEGAEALYRKLAGQSGDDPVKRAGNLALLARVLAESGDYEGAIGELKKAQQLAPGHLVFSMLHAEMLMQNGNIKGAISELEHYVSLDPGNQAARKVLDGLQGGWKGLKMTPGTSGGQRRQSGEAIQARAQISNRERSVWREARVAAGLGKAIKGGKATGEKITRELQGKGSYEEASGDAKQVFDTPGTRPPVTAPPLSLNLEGKSAFLVLSGKQKEILEKNLEWQMLKIRHGILQKKRTKIEKKIKENKRALEELEKVSDMPQATKDLTRNVLKETIDTLVKEELPKVEKEQEKVRKKAKKMISFNFDTSEKPENDKTPAK